MKPSRKPPSGTDDLFRSRLENIIDMGHLLVRLGAAIDWAFFDDATPSIPRKAAPASRRG